MIMLAVIGIVLIVIEIAWSRPYVDSPVNIGGPPNWMLLMGLSGFGLFILDWFIAAYYFNQKS